MTCTFTIPGEPQGKARARTLKSGHSYTPEKTVLYENWIRACYERQIGRPVTPLDEKRAVYMTIIAHFSIPASFSKTRKAAAENNDIRPTKKPDADNIAKVVCDALNGLAYADDTQVVSLDIRKVYGDPMVVVALEVDRT